MKNNVNYWVLVPAAGNSRRYNHEVPKQYQKIADKTVLEHTLRPFIAMTGLQKIVVVLAENDSYWPSNAYATHAKVMVTQGGLTRADSVWQGLQLLKEVAQTEDWVLVHDAARPCVSVEEIQALITSCELDAVGGILATPVTSTLKYCAQDNLIERTVARDQLWQAQTPQMFRFALLWQAFTAARTNNIAITDEAMAVELLGLKPRIVPGKTSNFKITYAEDLQQAENILRVRKQI